MPRAVGESAPTGQLGAPLRGVPSCCVKASSPIARRPSTGGPERALKGLCGGVLASLRGVSATGRRPVLRLTPTCCDSADFLALSPLRARATWAAQLPARSGPSRDRQAWQEGHTGLGRLRPS
eukprot:10250152-Alexandrium_andersonii.AAC.1